MGGHDIYLQYIPKNADPKNTARVYFACHPEDHHTYFDTVAGQLLSVGLSGGSTISLWHRNATCISADQRAALLEQLSSMQLFVVVVTARLLQDPGSCLDLEVAYAKANHIPILPLLWDSSLVTAYSRPENFGDLQFLNPGENDATALPYPQKLSEYLCSVLVGDELRQKVREAFDSYIFLSYRKKDRKAAQEVMKLIHQNDFCRDVAIWYDEFLTPGENFSQAIRDALEKSRLFVLVVTPNITEPHNYVIDHEYPMAKQAGKEILPLESLQTDRELLKTSFSDLPAITDAHDPRQLARALRQKLPNTAQKQTTPEHRYLMGLAYLNGIDVETDGALAENLLLSAAQEEHPLAMMTLSNMYQTGQGVARDYDKALFWMESACGVYVRLYQQDPDTHRISLINQLGRTANTFFSLEQHKNAIKYAQEAILYSTLGFRETKNSDFVGSALSKYFIKIPAQLSLWYQENPSISSHQFQENAFSMYRDAEAFLDECTLDAEQGKALGQYVYMLYSQLAMLSASLGKAELSREYSEKMRRVSEISSKAEQLNQQMVAALNEGSLDLAQWMHMLQKLLDIYQEDLDATPPSNKTAYLITVMTASGSIIVQLCQYAQMLDYDPDDMDLDLAEEILDRFAVFLLAIEADKLDPSQLCNLAAVFGTMAEFKDMRGRLETALEYNRLHTELAQRSFSDYPTEKALQQWALAVNGLDELYPDEPRHKALWLSLEETAESFFRRTILTPSGYDIQDMLYEALTICCEESQDLIHAEHYADKRAQCLRHKFRKSQDFTDELDYMEAQYQYCDYQRQNGRHHIDSSLRILLRRYGDLLQQQEQLQLDQQSYDRMIIQYCDTLYLMSQVQADYQNQVEAQRYLQTFVRIARHDRYIKHFADKLNLAIQSLCDNKA